MGVTYQGWRRPISATGCWEKVDGATGDTKGKALQRVMEMSELVAGDFVRYEYEVLPDGQSPALGPKQTYLHRMLRPS